MDLHPSGLENHPDGTGDLNAIVNSNWLVLNGWINPAQGLTASQSTTALTASADVFAEDDVGATVRWADGTTDTIGAFVSVTAVTMSTSQTKGSQAFELYRTDQNVRDVLLRSLIKRSRMLASDNGHMLSYAHPNRRLQMLHRHVHHGYVQTTSASAAILVAPVLDASTTTLIEASVVVRRASGTGSAEDGGGYKIQGVFKNVAGTATQIGATVTQFEQEDVAGWGVAFAVSGDEARLMVTGTGGVTLDWEGYIDYITATPP